MPSDPVPTAAPSPTAALVVLAGGSGSRFGGQLDGRPASKVYLPLAGARVISWSLRTAAALPEFGVLVLVVSDADRELVRRILAEDLAGIAGRVELVTGGASRHDSEWAALSQLAARIRAGAIDVVAIHDGARPLAGAALFRAVVAAARECGGAIPVSLAGLPAPGSATTAAPVPGAQLARAQTPQAFGAAELLAAYTAAGAEGFAGTDTASCVQRNTGVRVRAVPGPADNLKITFAEDLALAEELLRRAAAPGSADVAD